MTLSAFELLGLNPSFDLDLKALESVYFAAQRQYHPDRFVGKPDAQRAAAMQRSVDINQAYETLKNPLKRAQYLLQLQGIRVGTDTDSIKPSAAILTEAMEMREEPPAKHKLDDMIQQSITAIGEHYKCSVFADMAQETLRLGYILKAREDIVPRKALT
jgi:molecular chaperone HscB